MIASQSLFVHDSHDFQNFNDNGFRFFYRTSSVLDQILDTQRFFGAMDGQRDIQTFMAPKAHGCRN